MTDASFVRTTPAELTGGRPIVVLAPHPDDESLGCGILLAAAFPTSGAHVVCMTDGAASHPGSRLWPPASLAAVRRAELIEALRCLGGTAEDTTFLDLPDSGMPTLAPRFEEIAGTIRAILDRTGAASLLAPAPTDHHCDHEATAAIAALAVRGRATRLLHYPVWSRWDDPGFRRRLPHAREFRLAPGTAAEAKRRAIAAHRSQLGLVVDDDPSGFVLDPAFVEDFATSDELYFDVQPVEAR